MNTKHVLAILAGLSLVLPTLQLDASAAFQRDIRAPTSIELDLIEECTTTMSCNAEVFTGNTVTFTGMLTDGDGAPLADMSVNIVGLVPKPELIALATGMTDNEGMFEIEWVAKLSSQTTAFQDVTAQYRTESLTVFAEFPGDEEFASSKSNKLTMSITVNTIRAVMNSDKTLYNEGDTVTIFIAFIDSADNFVDPEAIFATLNNQLIELERKKEGSYTFILADVPKRHTQLVLVPLQSGYNASTAYLTIIIGGLR